MRKRLLEIYLQSDTLYAEWCMGIFSFVFGVWYTRSAFCAVFGQAQIELHIPQLISTALIFTGMAKMAGVYRLDRKLRRIAFGSAIFTWTFYSVAILMPGGLPTYGGVVMGVTFALLSAAVLIKLMMVTTNGH